MLYDDSVSLDDIRQLVDKLLSQTDAGLVLWRADDPDDVGSFRIIYSSQSAMQITNQDISSVVGKPLREAFPALMGTPMAQMFVDTLRDRKSRTLPPTLYSDDTFPERVYSLKTHWVDHDVVGVVAEDITFQAKRQGYFRRELQASDTDRARLARELHDEVGQVLAAGVILLRQLEAHEELDHATQQKVGELVEFCENLDESIRRLSAGLHPVALEQVGFNAAVADLCARLSGDYALQVELNLAPDDGLPAETKLALYRIVQEALSNVVRHADASTSWVHTQREDESFTMTVEDDGCGLLNATFGRGLTGILERAEMVGGSADISSRQGGGTLIVVTVPGGSTS